MQVEVPIGDVADRLSILEIKIARLPSEAARHNAGTEAEALRRGWAGAALPPLESLPEWDPLCAVNRALWDVEDALRGHESRGDFGPSFVDLARSVYRFNDRRAALKRAINVRLGSSLVEEKSYGAPAVDEA